MTIQLIADRGGLAGDLAGPSVVGQELVVLVDEHGHTTGTAPKQSVHHHETPRHLGFSCYVVNAAGQVLLTQRAVTKVTWPSVWTNSCCGHPAPGETLREAVTRRLAHELGMGPRAMVMLLEDFSYRAVMDNGVVEHELCPVVAVLVDGEPAPDPGEVDDLCWVSWEQLQCRVAEQPDSLSPWAASQLHRLSSCGSPLSWFVQAQPDSAQRVARGLDGPIRWPSISVPWKEADPLEPVRAPLRRLLEERLLECEDEVVTLEPLATHVTRCIRDLVLAGGKRLRPAFVYWGHRVAGADHDDGVLTAAAALELLHTFALIHDDVMDRSVQRRGRPSLHCDLATQHATDGLRGDHDWFGMSSAILAGDLVAVWADRLFDSTPLPADAVARARTVYTQLRIEVMVGQFLDLRLADSPAADEASAHRVALLKSGRYTVTRPLQLGAQLAGASRGVLDRLGCFGDEIGVAFQLRDDVLGVFGDPREIGKSTIDDLREGKRTLLVIKALELATGTSRRVLERSLGAPDLDDGNAARCRSVIEACGARRAVEQVIEQHHARALDALDSFDPGPAKDALEQLATAACDRNR